MKYHRISYQSQHSAVKAALSVTFDIFVLKIMFLFFKNTLKMLKFRYTFYLFRNNLQIISAKTTAFMLKINCLELLEGRK